MQEGVGGYVAEGRAKPVGEIPADQSEETESLKQGTSENKSCGFGHDAVVSWQGSFDKGRNWGQ